MSATVRSHRYRGPVCLGIVILANFGFLAACALAPKLVAIPVFGAVPIAVVGGMLLILTFIGATIACTLGDDDTAGLSS